MGETCSFPRILSKDFQLPQLKERNSYGKSQDVPQDKVLQAIFPRTYQQNRQSKVRLMIQNNKQKQFQDDKFSPHEKQALRLSVLFNFQSNKIRIYTRSQQTDLTSFVQLQIEFSYLTSVFYLLCKKEVKAKLFPRLVETQETNNYGAYSCELFCNGERHQVIIDDRMPTQNDSFLYLRIVKGLELWPLILEKSWCKQIGSYEKARGLSPEDAFQEITGIPAYTYTVKANNRPIIKDIIGNALAKGQWVALVARNGLHDLANRQVFYIQSIFGEQYTIISPYVSYNFLDYQLEKRGVVKVRQQDIFSHFEHVIVGYYKPDYIPVSLPVVSQAREEMVFQINIYNRQEVSIRINQFYQGYLAPNDRNQYEYSPVMMQLYQINEVNGQKKNCKLVRNCEGCSRSLSGSRSAQCSVRIFQPLQGKYLLRVEIGWLYPDILNRGNLVVYASEGNAQISQLKNTQLMFNEIYPSIFQIEKTKNLILHEHGLQVKTFDKQNSTIIMFHNVTNSVHHFQMDFSHSKNVELRGKQVKQRFAYIRLQPDQREIIQVLPYNLRQQMEIQNFEINKLPIKS